MAESWWSYGLREFERHLRSQNRRPLTIHGYQKDMEQLRAWMVGHDRGDDVPTTADLRRWLAELQESEATGATLARKRSAARHFFDSFNEPYAKMLSYLWGYFGAAATWLLGHMLIVYPRQDGMVAHPTLLLSAIGFTLAALYYMEHFEKLSGLIRRELLFVCLLIIMVLLASLYYEGSHLIV